jgi:hypothetical protein
MDALDFELEIGDPENQRYPVTARAPGGEAATSMHLAGTAEEFDRELAVISDAVLASSAVARRAIVGDERPVQQLGQRLFEALVTDDVRGLYVASAQRAARRAGSCGWCCGFAPRGWPGCRGSSCSIRPGRITWV